ncbi:hypothetical protein EMCRGX_G003600 [Ephydatia muelleri]
MEVHGFYGRPKHIPQSSKSETDIKLERLTEAVQANADSIKGVVQQMEVMPKEIGAVYRYYESRRRQFIDSHQSREEKAAANQKNSTKRRSQKKLYLKRQTVLKDEQERKKWAEIDPSYMTDESDYEKDLKKVKVTHKPVWRSNLLNRLVHKLDKRLAAKKETVEYTGFKQKERVAGLVSLSLVPNNAPAWAVDKADAGEFYSKSSTELVAKRTWTGRKLSSWGHVILKGVAKSARFVQ